MILIDRKRSFTQIWHLTIFQFSGYFASTSRWRHNGRDSVSSHQPHNSLLNRLFRRRSKKTSKLRVTGLCAGKSPWTGEFPAQMASNAESISIWWPHHGSNILVVGWYIHMNITVHTLHIVIYLHEYDMYRLLSYSFLLVALHMLFSNTHHMPQLMANWIEKGKYLKMLSDSYRNHSLFFLLWGYSGKIRMLYLSV